MSDTPQSFNIRVQQTDQGWSAEALGQRGEATNPLMAVCVWIKNARTAGELLLIAANPDPPSATAPRAEQADLLLTKGHLAIPFATTQNHS